MKNNLLLLCTLLLAGFVSCQQEDTADNQYSDSEFLNLSNGINLTKGAEMDNSTLSMALSRLDIYKGTDGFYHIKQTSGDDVHMSEDLFNHFKDAVNYTNQLFETKSLNVSAPRLRSISHDLDKEDIQTDCLSRAIWAANNNLNWNDINSYMNNNGIIGSNKVTHAYRP